MIFVTVGTHEQPFNRLVECVDKLIEAGKINEEVFIQTGYSTYKPKYCKWSKFLPFQDMIDMVEKARIVITHGGPSSFIMPLQMGKIPIVVPRQKKYEEHINDHQLEFCEKVSDINNNIILIDDIDKVWDIISNYDITVNNMSLKSKDNNINFCVGFENIIKEIFDNNH